MICRRDVIHLEQIAQYVQTSNNLSFTKTIRIHAHELQNQFHSYIAKVSPPKWMYLSARQFDYTEARNFILQVVEYILVYYVW